MLDIAFPRAEGRGREMHYHIPITRPSTPS